MHERYKDQTHSQREFGSRSFVVSLNQFYLKSQHAAMANDEHGRRADGASCLAWAVQAGLTHRSGGAVTMSVKMRGSECTGGLPLHGAKSLPSN